MSPEMHLLENNEHTKINPWKELVWNLGVIIYELVYLERPYFCKKNGSE